MKTNSVIENRSVTGLTPQQSVLPRDTAKIAEQCISEWERRRVSAISQIKEATQLNNCICISRKIGVGALEVAYQLAEDTGLHVIDREILEYIAYDADLCKSTVEFFDEKHPGTLANIGAMLFGEKSFSMSEYMRNLISTVYSLANDSPTIFVGRAAHLFLPRERTLAVRLISSKEVRIKRAVDLLDITISEAEKMIDEEDSLQRNFFMKNFKKKNASAYEFDLVVNRDFFPDIKSTAQLIEKAYKLKFGSW